jgi:hypothetical protein
MQMHENAFLPWPSQLRLAGAPQQKIGFLQPHHLWGHPAQLSKRLNYLLGCAQREFSAPNKKGALGTPKYLKNNP